MLASEDLPDVMCTWAVREPGPLTGRPLRLTEKPVPQPGPADLLVRVTACGVCRTDLHLVEGDLPAHAPDVVPGHEAVGRVVAAGDLAARFALGSRVGVPWLRSTCQRCVFCKRGEENLCPSATYTGWDADGGYAEYVVVPDDYAYALPDGYSDEEAAPLLCAGIIGYRALRRAVLPPGGVLGIYGFGASAHLTAQVALAQGARVHVRTRSEEAMHLATALGAASVGTVNDRPPEPLDAAIVFAPAGSVVPAALEAVGPGGTVSVAGIHLTDIPPLDYRRHLFQERTLRSVTANTRQDGEEFLRLAARDRLRVSVTPYAFAEAAAALADMAAGTLNGVGVLRIGGCDSQEEAELTGSSTSER